MFVRHAGTYVTLAAIVYVPLGVVQLAFGDLWTSYADTFSKMFSDPAHAAQAAAINARLAQRMRPQEFVILGLSVFVAPLIVAAVVRVTLNYRDGAFTPVREALRFALSRWAHAVLFVICWSAMFGVAFVALIFGLTIAVATVVMATHSLTVAISFAVIIFALFAILMVVGIAGGCIGMMVAVTEPGGALKAVGSAVVLTFNRKTYWRTVVFGLLLCTLSFGFSVVSGAAGFGLFAALHTAIPLIVINAVVAIVQFAFLTVFCALFYADLRLRREGDDLQTLASRLAS
ncbi:MAG: hypothetical protein NVS9B12_09050 [Vulcanimicrobiaceae bacterium]